jgi:hypothetical protein
MPTQLISRIPRDQIGGARVFRPCTIGGVPRKSGDILSAEILAGLPPTNLRTLQDQRYILAWPKSADAPPQLVEEGEPHVYNRVGTSTYDVVLGRRLNSRPLSKTDAEELAARYQKPAAA